MAKTHIDLPLDANIKFQALNDKLMLFNFDGLDKHLTVHLGMATKLLDVHKTFHISDPDNCHNTDLVLRHFTIGRILVWIKQSESVFLRFLFGKIIPMNKLWKMGIVLNDIGNPELLEKGLKITKNKQKIELLKKLPITILDHVHLCPNQIKISQEPCGYAAYRKRGNKIKLDGIVITLPNSKDVVYLNLERIKKFVNKQRPKFMAIVAKEMEPSNQLKLKQILDSKLEALRKQKSA